MDKPKITVENSVTDCKYKYFKYLYKLRKLQGKFPINENSLFSDTSSDSDNESDTKQTKHT